MNLLYEVMRSTLIPDVGEEGMIRSMNEHKLRYLWDAQCTRTGVTRWDNLDSKVQNHVRILFSESGSEGAPPVPLILYCPACGERHVDEGEQATKPHRTHACQECGVLWAPAVVPTVGVRFLPGCKT